MLEAYFTPISESIIAPFKGKKHTLGAKIKLHNSSFPKLNKSKIAIFGLQESANLIRTQLYALNWRFDNIEIVDLGNLVDISDIKQREFAFSEALGELNQLNINCIILGDDQGMLFSQYHAYRNHSEPIEIVNICSGLSFENDTELYRIVSHDKNHHLFNIDFVGTQAYNISTYTATILEKLYFENHRLGNIRAQIEETEPVLRSSHLMMFDLNAIRSADASAISNSSPNGFYAEEAAKIARYAGLSNKLSSAYFYGFNPDSSIHSENSIQQTSLLIAQMIWYYIEGFTTRYNDHPTPGDSDYLIYRNKLENTGHEITFYKSRKSNRWWMEIPHPYDNNSFYIGCSYNDYLMVSNGEMPDRWWRAYQRLIV
jgi:formiminoglutamase